MSKMPVPSRIPAQHEGEQASAAATPIPMQPGSSLAALRGQKPKTKSGQVQSLWPEIKAALREGHTIRQVWECLLMDGLELSYSRLRWYVARLKRKEAAGADLPQPRPDHGNVAVRPKSPRDPLSNLREHLNRRPGFEFDDRPPDEKKLI